MSKEIKKNIQNKAANGTIGDAGKRPIKFGQGNFLQDGSLSTQSESTTTLGGIGIRDGDKKKTGTCCQ